MIPDGDAPDQHASFAAEEGPDRSSAVAVLREALAWARERDYAGYDPYDGLNSRLLSPLARNWLTRLLVMQAVHKAPVNVRPFVGVPRERNPQGVALFAQAYLGLYEVAGEDADRSRAEELLSWLLENRSPAFDLPSWGYNFDWQNARKFHLPAHHPSIVVTTFCGRAFLEHHRLTGDGESLTVARDAARFVDRHVNTRSVDGTEAFTYTPYDDFVVVNANALAADYCYQLAGATGSGELRERARRLFGLVVDLQTDEGAWYYAVPAEESHLTHDNFHTGFVLESLHDFAREEGGRPERAYDRGLAFYRDRLFEPDGAPRFEHERPYPRDVHAAAQGVITFAQAGDDRTAGRILAWALENLYDDEGYFYRRVGRVLTDETPYMRWNQAWMCRALSAYVRS